MKIGYFLACEEFGPQELLRQARLAEESGFDALWISDHFHPWMAEQGQSPFVWSVLGALSTTTHLPVATAVTCPTTRIHPGIIAQAASTSSLMLGGRFVLGVGSGEALNEQVFGDPWPAAGIRLEMLEEAVHVIRLLQEGGYKTYRGTHYTLEKGRIWTLPEQPTPIYVSGFGPRSIRLAARIGDGYVCNAPNAEFVRMFRENGGGDKPVQGGVKACWAETEEAGVETAHRVWANEQLPGELGQVLSNPRHIEQAVTQVPKEKTRESFACGPDPQRHIDVLQEYADAGFDEVYVQQIGPQQEPFFDFYAKEVMPALRHRTG